jgi:plastocyanin
MKRLLIVLTGCTAAIVLTVAAGVGSASVRPAAKAPGKAAIVIHHQLHGCHAWSLNGGAYRAALTVRLARGGTIMVTNNDVMPHKVIRTSGPAVRFGGTPALRHMGASVKVTFPTAGVYRFTTKAGEDYMAGVKTIGEDNVLRLTVRVS